jgi:hypothetical protein
MCVARNARAPPCGAAVPRFLLTVRSLPTSSLQVEDEWAAELLAVETRYAALRQPLQKERSDVIGRIPGFWANVFASDVLVSPLITPSDAAVLAHVTHFEVETMAGLDFALMLRLEDGNPFCDGPMRKDFRTGKEGHTTATSSIAWRRDTPQGREATATFVPGALTFFSWFSCAQTFAVGHRDGLAEHLAEVYRNPLLQLLPRGTGKP